MEKPKNQDAQFFEQIPSPQEIWHQFPATISQISFVEQSRKQITRILKGEDSRLLLVLGPCSIHDWNATIHYAEKIQGIFEEISDLFFPVMRFHFEKPRTISGWTGIMHDPHLNGSSDLTMGLKITRQLLLELANLGIPAAAELLNPISGYYFGDLLSLGSIGARTSSSQIHRQLASGLSMPVGFKNTPDGNIDIPIHGISSASQAHSYIGLSPSGRVSVIHTQGNANCHLVLRGSERSPNYDRHSIKKALEKLRQAELPEVLLIDCAHGNAKKDHKNQPKVFKSIMEQRMEGNFAIKGLMLESHLYAGKQPFTGDPSLFQYATSLTDPCISWEMTEQLLLSAKTILTTSKA